MRSFNNIHKGSDDKCSWTVPSKGLPYRVAVVSLHGSFNDIHDLSDQDYTR